MPLGAARFGLLGGVADLGKLELIETQTYSSAVSFVDFTSIDESTYNVHFVTLNNLQPTTDTALYMYFYESGVLETAGVYRYADQQNQSNGNAAETRQNTSTYLGLGNFAVGPSNGYCYFYNLGDSSKYSFTTYHSFVEATSTGFGFGSGVLPQTSVVDGIQIYTYVRTLTSGTASLYGIRYS